MAQHWSPAKPTTHWLPAWYSTGHSLCAAGDKLQRGGGQSERKRAVRRKTHVAPFETGSFKVWFKFGSVWPGVMCIPPSGPAGGRTLSSLAKQSAAFSPRPEFV